MEVEAIWTFVEVVRLGSFAPVARARGRALEHLLADIVALEAALAVLLFQRTALD